MLRLHWASAAAVEAQVICRTALLGRALGSSEVPLAGKPYAANRASRGFPRSLDVWRIYGEHPPTRAGVRNESRQVRSASGIIYIAKDIA